MKLHTNVQPEDLNYDHYETEVYDEDIKRSIPGYTQLHDWIDKCVLQFSQNHEISKILELGIGTGLTTVRILKIVPKAQVTAIDFSEQMLQGARKRLKNYDVIFKLGDYSKIKLDANFDLVVSVIGIHHQSKEGKKKLFERIYNALKPGALFIFADLVTYRDKNKAALNEAEHFHHLVEQARDEKALIEWSYHHKFLNELEPIEDQIEWLEKIGFSEVKQKYEYMNTALIVAKK